MTKSGPPYERPILNGQAVSRCVAASGHALKKGRGEAAASRGKGSLTLADFAARRAATPLDELREGLNDAALEFAVAKDLVRSRKPRAIQLEKIEANARRLLVLLKEPGPWREIVRHFLPLARSHRATATSGWVDASPNASIVKSVLSRLIEATSAAVDSTMSAASTRRQARDIVSPNDASAADWLVGVRLTRLFEDHFGVAVGLKRDGKLDTPFLRFADRVLAELKIEGYSRSSMVRAVTSAKRAGEWVPSVSRAAGRGGASAQR